MEFSLTQQRHPDIVGRVKTLLPVKIMEQQNFEKLNPQNKDLVVGVREIADEFFKKMGFEVEIEALFLKDETLSLNLKTREAGYRPEGFGTEARFSRGGAPPEAAILIGERGQTLFDIQCLLRAILKKKTKENFYFDLDINNYKKKKAEYLKELATSIAEEVISTRQEKELPAMPPSERRIIHMELSLRQDVRTESVGQEPNRRIIVRPCP